MKRKEELTNKIELSRKYVDKLSSDDFKVFLERYNHATRFINEEMNEESIEIFDSLILEDPELIEPYVILILLYEKTGKTKEKEELLERLRFVDADNHLFDKDHDHIDEDKFHVAKAKKENKQIKKLREHKKILTKKIKIKRRGTPNLYKTLLEVMHIRSIKPQHNISCTIFSSIFITIYSLYYLLPL